MEKLLGGGANRGFMAMADGGLGVLPKLLGSMAIGPSPPPLSCLHDSSNIGS